MNSMDEVSAKFNAVTLPESNDNVKSEKWILEHFLNGKEVKDRYNTESYYVKMTDKIARALYEARWSENRRITEGNVLKMMRDIMHGDWKKTSDAFKVWFQREENGKVVPIVGDANHRTIAFWRVLNQNGSIPDNCYIRLTAVNPPEIAWLTDKNKTRSTIDSLKISGKEPEYCPIAKEIGRIVRSANHASAVSENEVYRFAEKAEHQYNIIQNVFQSEFSSNFEKAGFGKKGATRTVFSSILAVGIVRKLSDAQLERAARYAFQCLLVGLKHHAKGQIVRENTQGLPDKKEPEDVAIIALGLARELSDAAQVGGERLISGYKAVRLAGLATIAALENRFCGKHHGQQYIQHTPHADDEINKAYVSEVIFG